jgi:hypothetical protein
VAQGIGPEFKLQYHKIKKKKKKKERKSKMDWKCGSRDRALTLQELSSNPSPIKKKKVKFQVDSISILFLVTLNCSNV